MNVPPNERLTIKGAHQNYRCSTRVRTYAWGHERSTGLRTLDRTKTVQPNYEFLSELWTHRITNVRQITNVRLDYWSSTELWTFIRINKRSTDLRALDPVKRVQLDYECFTRYQFLTLLKFHQIAQFDNSTNVRSDYDSTADRITNV